MYFDQIANMMQAEEVATRKTKIQFRSTNAFERLEINTWNDG